MRFLPNLLRALLSAFCCSASALAQPVQLPPAFTTPVGALLASAPDIVIANGLLSARIARIDAARGFYNGTRFDQAGVVTSLTLNGREFYGPWFEARLKPSSDLIRSAVLSCRPVKIMTPSPGVWICFSKTLNPSASPNPNCRSLTSISRLEESFRDFCTSRMHTASMPRWLKHSSISSSAKKCDLPDPRPPKAPLYRAGASSGRKTLGVSI